MPSDLAPRRLRHLTSITNSNAQAFAIGLWDEVLAAHVSRYQDVTVRTLLVDAVATRRVLAPQEFDVIVASNLFGDILGDLGGAVVGSPRIAARPNLDRSAAIQACSAGAPLDSGHRRSRRREFRRRSRIGRANARGARARAGGDVGDADDREAAATAQDLGGDCPTSEFEEAIAVQLPAPATSLVQQ